ncbi:glycosyltransferase [Bryobacter aggregatus]|uniref:glycosyltransferase n=1 Tax=Bryobacter aggregatus TaxID=360054 RepID=UPI0004E1A008|nr:glycosyltransferase [Bryobacter aggregatus]
MILLKRVLRQLPIVLLSPLFLLVELVTLWLVDLLWHALGEKKLPPNQKANQKSASVVIPNWNGKDLLEKYLPSVVDAMSGHPDNEVIVVDNGSEDGSAAFVRAHFPSVKLVALKKNLGFGGGSNRGFREAKNDVVVLLNSDMRVDRDFLAPLLKGFADADVFAVSCQIFFSDPNKLREETGLTQAHWKRGFLQLRHRIDEQVTDLFPCFYGGGGSCAFDRNKFLELGGFDELLRPFYLEDTDLGYLAWKRGWRVLYQPQSKVWHEHRGTIGKKFSREYIQSIVLKNYVLFAWKNIHAPSMLLEHFASSYASAWISLLFGDRPGRANFPSLFRAALQIFGAAKARWRARCLADVDDKEAMRRPMGGYYRDRFEPIAPAPPQKPRVLMVSPYGLAPASHGGAVFMQLAVRELSKHAEVHLIALVDEEWERYAHEELEDFTASMQFLVRMTGKPAAPFSLTPSAVEEFANEDLEWMIHRTILDRKIDVLQLEYTNLGQYACDFQRLLCAIFEHDIYFQSISRQIATNPSLLWRIPASIEYLKAMHWEMKMLDRCDLIEVCTGANLDYVQSLKPSLAPRLRDGLRASIPVKKFQANLEARNGNTVLFVGGFRHLPNLEALQWFFDAVVPILKQRNVDFKVLAIGMEPPPTYAFANSEGILELPGYRESIASEMASAPVFICPILAGSGIRVKLLEAFASGIPVVSTRVGAEGLSEVDGEHCRLATTAEEFADGLEALLGDRTQATAMANRAHQYVSQEWDSELVIARLAAEYRRRLAEKAITSCR